MVELIDLAREFGFPVAVSAALYLLVREQGAQYRALTKETLNTILKNTEALNRITDKINRSNVRDRDV